MSNTRTVTQNPDGTLNITLKDTRTAEEKLKTLSFGERLALMYPTNPVDVTKDWVKFDDHKRCK